MLKKIEHAFLVVVLAVFRHFCKHRWSRGTSYGEMSVIFRNGKYHFYIKCEKCHEVIHKGQGTPCEYDMYSIFNGLFVLDNCSDRFSKSKIAHTILFAVYDKSTTDFWYKANMSHLKLEI